MVELHDHPYLSISIYDNQGIYKALIFGGSCITPTQQSLKQANYFISLDVKGLDQREDSVPLNYLFPIEDGKVPENIKEFNKMIDFLCSLLRKKINLHIGCLGSHGRTGLVMSAIVQKMCQPLLEKLDMSAIDYVRSLYCIYAVENTDQEHFLINHCNVKKPQMSEI